MMNSTATRTIIGIVVWILLTGVPVKPAAGAPESDPSPGAVAGLASQVEKAKIQALFQVKQDMSIRSILWYQPFGFVILLSEDSTAPFRIQSVSLEGLGESPIEYSYSGLESRTIRKGGVVRLYSTDQVDQDLKLKISVKLHGDDGQEHTDTKSLTIGHRGLPSVLELQIVAPKGDDPALNPVVLGKADSDRLTRLFTRHVRYLLDTDSHLEAAALLSILRAQKKGLKDQGGWTMDLASTLIKWNVHGEAVPILHEMTAKGSPRTQASIAWFYIGKLDYKDGNYKKALEAFSKAKPDLPPEYLPEVLYLTGNSHLYQKAYRPAIESFNQVPASSEFYPYSLYSRGLSYLNQGDVKATKESFVALMKIDPRSDETLQLLIDRAHITLGYFLVDQKKYEDAIQAFSTVRDKSIYEDQSRFGIGWAMYNTGQCDKAAVVFDDLIKTWPASIYSEEARIQAGQCYAQLGAHRKAVESFQEALRQYSLKKDALQAIEQNLSLSPLGDWLKTQRQEFSKTTNRNPLIRELTSEATVQKAISDFETLGSLSEQVDRISKSLDEALQTMAFKKRLTQVRDQAEEEAKAEVARGIQQIQKQVDERANQADIGLLKNFGVEE